MPEECADGIRAVVDRLAERTERELTPFERAIIRERSLALCREQWRKLAFIIDWGVRKA